MKRKKDFVNKIFREIIFEVNRVEMKPNNWLVKTLTDQFINAWSARKETLLKTDDGKKFVHFIYKNWKRLDHKETVRRYYLDYTQGLKNLLDLPSKSSYVYNPTDEDDRKHICLVADEEYKRRYKDTQFFTALQHSISYPDPEIDKKAFQAEFKAFNDTLKDIIKSRASRGIPDRGIE